LLLPSRIAIAARLIAEDRGAAAVLNATSDNGMLARRDSCSFSRALFGPLAALQP